MSNLKTFFRDLFRHDLEKMPPLKRSLVTVLRFLVELQHQFTKDTVIVRASGMAYTTLLAIVPLVAVFFSIFSALFADEMKVAVQNWLIEQIIPVSPDQIVFYLNKFTANTKALGLFATVALVLTSVLLFDNIEKNFNSLWHVIRPRSFWRRFMAFTMVLVWGPVLIALSFYTSGRIRAYIDASEVLEIGLLSRLVFGIVPWLLTVFAFFLMLYVIPATKVKMKSALIGGLIGGTMWEFAKVGFSNYVARSITYNAIYGSLALIPFFLVWLYLTWIIVLLSVESSYVHHNFRSLILHRVFTNLSLHDRLHLSMRLFTAIARRFHEGGEPYTASELADRYAMPFELVEDLIELFVEQGMLARTDLAKDRTGYLPNRSLDALKVKDVFRAAYLQQNEGVDLENTDDVDKVVGTMIQQGELQAFGSFGDHTVLEIVTRRIG
ncbi:MAG TPA: YhjD/YihY/BrkB family envelope integrity protein [bacterium]|nr:YhjD/YihY/BrkB family envelope integrity protein [bacterium]